MKKIMLLLMSSLAFCLLSCEDVEVGYLEIENASYSKDTLYLYNVEDRLVEYQGYQAEFNAQGGAEYLRRIDEIEKEVAKIQAQADVIYEELINLYDLYDSGSVTGTELEELEAEIARTEVKYEALREEMYEIDITWDIKQELKQFTRDLWKSFGQTEDIDQLAFAMGRLVQVWEVIPNTISKLQNTVTLKIPWSTAPIEGILGTEPMSYGIAGVKNENAENAELFRKALSIMGGGIMHVVVDVEAPAGRYSVSVLVKNEGQHAVLEDVFTFIVEE